MTFRSISAIGISWGLVCSSPLSAKTSFGLGDISAERAVELADKAGEKGGGGGTHTLTVTPHANGTVVSVPAGISCGSQCGAQFGEGASVTLRASAAPGYSFSGWAGACSGANPACVVTMDQARLVTPSFHLSSQPAHPRLYINDAKINLLKTRITAQTEPYYAHWVDIQGQADRFIAQTPPIYPTDPLFSSSNVDSAIRQHGNKLPFMALAYKLTDDPKYLAGTKKWLNALVSYTKWGTDSDLGAAHLLYNMAIAYDWLYHDLTASERMAYEKKMDHHLSIYRGLITQPDPIWWADAWNQNHNHVNFAAVMTAAVGAYENVTAPDSAIQLAYDNFTQVLSNLSPDGASHEGASYSSYAMEALLRYFEIEKSRTGVDRLLTAPHVQNHALYRFYAARPSFWQTVDFGDSVGYDYYGPDFLLYRLAATFADKRAQWLARTINERRTLDGVSARADWRSLLWYNESIGETGPSALPTARLFDNLEIFTSRSAWLDPDAIFLAFKAGPPLGHAPSVGGGAGHVHPDEGGFTLEAFGRELIIDDGYSYLKKTSNHNVATFGGVGQRGEGSQWFQERNSGVADVVHADLNTAAGTEYLVADLAGVYKPELKITRYIRHLVFLKKRALVVIDDIDSTLSHPIEWRLHLNYDSTFAVRGRALSGTLDGSNVGLLVEDVSTDTHDYSIAKEIIAVDHTTKDKDTVFYTNTFLLSKNGTQARVEAVIRPFQGTAPAPVLVARNGGTLSLTFPDGSVATINTATRVVTMTP